MNILEAAEILKDLAICIAKQKGITVQEAYQEATKELNEIQKNQESLECKGEVKKC